MFMGSPDQHLPAFWNSGILKCFDSKVCESMMWWRLVCWSRYGLISNKPVVRSLTNLFLFGWRSLSNGTFTVLSMFINPYGCWWPVDVSLFATLCTLEWMTQRDRLLIWAYCMSERFLISTNLRSRAKENP